MTGRSANRHPRPRPGAGTRPAQPGRPQGKGNRPVPRAAPLHRNHAKRGRR